MLPRRTLLKSGIIGLSVSALIMTIGTNAFAHKQRLSLTHIDWNERSKTLDIIHSFHIHEAENTLYESGLIRYPDLTKLKARARLALYTSERFSLSQDGSEALKLEIIGAEIDGQSVYVYQQIALNEPPKRLIVSNTIFRELVKDQINNVDVNIDGEIKSLQFKGNDGPKSVTL